MAVLEPLALLFREEVRAIAETLGMDNEHRAAQALPADGLGGADHRRGDPGETGGALRKADAIFSEEIREAGLNRKLYKYFPIMVDADELKGRCTIILRAVTVPARCLFRRGCPMIWWSAPWNAFGDDARRSARVLRPDADAGWKKRNFNKSKKTESDPDSAGGRPRARFRRDFFSSSNAFPKVRQS